MRFKFGTPILTLPFVTSVHDIHRNALVCVFLRTLEYYQGMMFLTTNWVGQLDDPIASRIHFKQKYDNVRSVLD